MAIVTNRSDYKTVSVIFLFAISLLILSCRNAPQQATQVYPQEEFLAREASLDGDTFRYRFYVPQNKKAGERLPVMLYLHGAGNRGDDNQSQLNGLADIIRSNPEKFSFIVVIPQCASDRFWDAQMLARANKAVDDTVATFAGDTERLYLAGFSLGGYGVWTMAAMYPGKFAALVPMAGRVLPRSSEMKNISPQIVDLAKAPDPYRAFAERNGKTPVWIFHGSDDGLVPVESSRKMIEALKSAGNDRARYTEVAGAGHEPLGFRNSELFQWLANQKLKDSK